MRLEPLVARVQQVFAKLGIKMIVVDEEVWVWHINGELTSMLTIHADDFKMIGKAEQLAQIIGALEKVFGKMTQLWDEFTTCGMHHRCDPSMGTSTLDQHVLIAAQKPIAHTQPQRGNVCANQTYIQYSDRCWAQLHMPTSRGQASVSL